MIPLTWFHDPWKKMMRIRNNESELSGDSNAVTSTSLTPSSDEIKADIYESFSSYLYGALEILWRVSEIHLTKLLFLILVIFAANDVTAINTIIILIASVAFLSSYFTTALCFVTCFYLLLASVSVSLKSIYEKVFEVDNSENDELNNSTCSIAFKRHTTISSWIGMNSADHPQQLFGIIISLIGMSAIYVVYKRQKTHRQKHNLQLTRDNLVFLDFDPRTYDESLVNLSKFMIDYTFYKFGLEIAMIFMTVTAWQRMDMLALILMVCLIFFTCVSREITKNVWPIFVSFCAFIVPIQYIMTLGLPQLLCFKYPWLHLPDLTSHFNATNAFRFLNLADYNKEIIPENTICDFILLILVTCQHRVFVKESSTHPAGDNSSIYKKKPYILYENNPRRDFISKTTTSVDYLKCSIFSYAHWLSLLFVFIAGLGGTSLFALGYVLLAFFMLWQGTSLYCMKNYDKTLMKWNILLIYNIAAMLFKINIQFVACVFADSSDLQCLLRQIFSIVCVYDQNNDLLINPSCTVSASEARIGFDIFCFAFLIFQLRILNSYYFQYCIIDFRCQIVSSNRGAVLKNQLIEKQMKEQNEREINKLREIKNRTATIRKRYEEQQTAGDVSYFTPETYGQVDLNHPHTNLNRISQLYSNDEDDPLPHYGRSLSTNIVKHDINSPAKRAGDYYMFNYDPITQSLDASDDGVPEVDPGCTDSGITPAQLAYLAVDKNFQLDKTLKAVKSSDNILNEDDRINKAIQRDQDESESLKKSEESCGLSGIRFILKLLETGLAYVAAFLNRQTREHRYVSYVLNQEKITLRNKLGVSLYDCRKSISDIRKEWDMKKLYCVRNESDIIKMENLALTKWNDRNVIGRFLTAAGFCVSAYTDILCYILAIVAHAKCGLITMPLPLMVFCWGTLASPRPSKLFWICMIAYTQAVIILKFVVQFGEMGNEDSASATSFDDDSTFAQFLQFAGLVKMNGYAIWDVFLLFALFFHRYYLRSLGLWKAANVNVTFLKSSFNEEENVECEIKNTELPTVEVIETVELPPEDRTSIQSSNHQITVEKNNKESVTSSEPFIKNALRTFFENLFHPKFRSIKDLYPFMFLMDVIAFFIVVFGYKYFGDGSTGNVISDISSNRVPLAFVLMMIVMSMMLVVDRGLYLRKAKYCKFAYHIVTIIFLHIWLFIFLPKITTYQARANKAGMFLYIVKGIYLLISAWQIRNGYPVLCSGNLITHRYGLINMVCFKIFQAVPFLYEMRTAIDWTWTDTSMPLFDYFNMENYYAVVYNLKCARTFENKYPAPRGVAKATIVKYLMGVPMILILIFVIWCPLLAFALLNTIGLQLPPESVKMSIGIEGFPPIYTIESQGIDISNLTPKEYNAFISNIRNIDSIGKPYVKSRTKAALSFSEDYTFEDVHRILFRPESENMWRISSQSLSALHKQLNGTRIINIKINLELTRARQSSGSEPVKHTTTFIISMPLESITRINLTNIIDSNTTFEDVTIHNALPAFLSVPNEGQLSPAYDILNLLNEKQNTNRTFMDLSLKKLTDSFGTSWSTQPEPTDAILSLMPQIPKTTYEGSNGLLYIQLIVFVNRVYPSYINKYISGGIIAMYIALVLMLHRLIRGMITNTPIDVIITEIPNPDYLLKICLDIYLVREAKDFLLEQDLFAKLIFLFRSPATLIKWTRYKVKAD